MTSIGEDFPKQQARVEESVRPKQGGYRETQERAA